MQIETIRTKLKAFECKFLPFEWESKHLNTSLNHSKGIRSIRMQILTIQKEFECKFKPLEKRFKELGHNFEQLQRDLKHSNVSSNRLKTDSKRWNATSNHLKKIRNSRMQIRTIRKGFEAFEYKFK